MEKGIVYACLLGLAACQSGTPPVESEPGDRSRPSDSLPALKRAPELRVRAGTELRLALQLEPGWKINDKAPSWAGLYRDGRLVRELSRAELEKGGGALSVLGSGEAARLQGSFYFCEKTRPSVCVLRSHDQTLRSDDGVTTITIELKK
jgi:hypothetical protein